MNPRNPDVKGTRERIREVALELFIAQGFERTSLREIADRLGFSKAALYYHYPSKAELIADILQPVVESLGSFLEHEAHIEPRPLREFLTEYFDVVWTHRVVWLALTRDPSGLAELDLEQWILNLYRVAAAALVGEEASPYNQARVQVAIGGLSRAAMMPSQIPLEVLREGAVDAALGAIGRGGDELTCE